MKIINEVENKLFGNLCCFANDEGEPLFWGKQLKMKFLSQEEQNVVIGLNIYCFDVNFNTKGWDDEDVDSVLKEIYSQYQIFLSDCKGIDDIFIKEFNVEKKEWDIQAIIESKEDLYFKIQVIQVDIIKDSYIINFLLDNEEWSFIVSYDETLPPCFSINPRCEVPFAEMDY